MVGSLWIEGSKLISAYFAECRVLHSSRKTPGSTIDGACGAQYALSALRIVKYTSCLGGGGRGDVASMD